MPMERPLTGNIRPDGEPLDRDAYERAGGYHALRKALQSMTPAEVTEEVKESNLRGRGGAGFSDRHEMELYPKGTTRRIPNTWSPTPTRWSPARSRTGCDGRRSAPVDRRHDLCRHMRPGGRRLHLPARRIQARSGAASQRRSPKPTPPAISGRTFSAPATASNCICTSAPAATCAAKRPAC